MGFEIMSIEARLRDLLLLAALGVALPLELAACDDGEAVCDRGESQPCLCGAGAQGAQLCSADLQGWELCDCGGADGDADSDADGDADSEGEAPEPWVTVRAGSFTMGVSGAEPCADITGRFYAAPHEVTLTRDFELRSTEVTQAEFEEVMGYNPSGFAACGGRCPVERVSWHEAAAFCNALSDSAGLDRCYECAESGEAATCTPAAAFAMPYECPGYRLPTEAEWEYAARAGTSAQDYGEWLDARDALAWYSENSGMTPHGVAQKGTNAFGLHDMLGNVWEWCHDWYEGARQSALTDPWGPAAPNELVGPFRVLRGGCWGSLWDVGYPCRYNEAPTARFDFIGFRPARTL